MLGNNTRTCHVFGYVVMSVLSLLPLGLRISRVCVHPCVVMGILLSSTCGLMSTHGLGS